jgi:hypothetical protein
MIQEITEPVTEYAEPAGRCTPVGRAKLIGSRLRIGNAEHTYPFLAGRVPNFAATDILPPRFGYRAC